MIYKTPIGPLKLEATDEGVCAVKWLFGKHSDSEQLHHSGAPPQAQRGHENEAKKGTAVVDGGTKCKGSKAEEHLQVCQTWLDAYFAGTLLKAKPPKPDLVLPPGGKCYGLISTQVVWQ